MKQAYLCKHLDAGAVTDEQLAKIARYSKRPLTGEEVYVFAVALCDNEIDRDFERFPTSSLEALRDLYLGKTGVFDHTPTAENQSARIFDACLEQTGEVNSLGEPYVVLKAWAYMARCAKNADLILEIEAGIKKEVSVGCAVARVLCSVCGEEQAASGCAHAKGELYGGRRCHHLLTEPTDAYEWSFVAVPAQRQAGVVKRRGENASREDGACSGAKLKRLERLAALGERYETELRGRVVRLGLLSHDDLDAETLERIAAKLRPAELQALEKSFSAAAGKRYPIASQLGRGGSGEPGGELAFKI